MENTLISIIIPTYNRAHLIGETLDSILAQTYTNWECIVVDDGSTDNTKTVLQQYSQSDSRIRYFLRPEQLTKGANTCRNYGFEKSKGEYINWFDDDDIMLPDFLLKNVSAFRETLNYVICTGSYYYDDNSEIKKIELYQPDNIFRDYVLGLLKIFTPSVMIRKSALLSDQLFNNKLKRGQETDFFSRYFYKLNKEEYLIKNESLFLYRQHRASKTGKNETYNKPFKESETYVAMQNLKRSVLIKDKKLINFLYKVLVNLLYRAIEHNHKSNALFIKRELVKMLKPLNPSLMITFNMVSTFFISVGKGSYKFEQYLKKNDVL